jgi:hypothetical protein
VCCDVVLGLGIGVHMAFSEQWGLSGALGVEQAWHGHSFVSVQTIRALARRGTAGHGSCRYEDIMTTITSALHMHEERWIGNEL